MNFSEFSKTLQKLENEPSRNEMTEILAGFLKSLDRDEIQPVMYMLTARIAPAFIPVEFNFSSKLILKAIEQVDSIDKKDARFKLSSLGDIGLAVEETMKPQKCTLSIQQVYDLLVNLAGYEGKGSQESKMRSFLELRKKLDPISMRYVSRIITGDLRLGLSDKTMLDSISWVMQGDKSFKSLLERAYGFRADLGYIASLALTKGEKSLELIKIQPGIPVASKLVQREKSVKKVFERMPSSIVQPKYDGLRTQIHFSKEGFKDEFEKPKGSQNYGFDLGSKKELSRIFSRNMEPLTDMFPDIVNEMQRLKVNSIVLDAEAIGIDPKTGKFIPFQETIKRKRKYGVKGKALDIPIKVFIFDCLFVNGVDISQFPLELRLGVISRILVNGNKFGLVPKKIEEFSLMNIKPLKSEILKFSESLFVQKQDQMQKLFDGYLAKNLEGAIVKDPASPYIPGTRTYDWIKLKANIDKDLLIDEIDCVVLGYYHGRGARAKFGIGAFLLGVYDKKQGNFKTIAKVGSGIKDEDWPQIKKDLESIEISKKPKNVEIKKELMPDVLCEPKIVVVVQADEISRSSNHTAGYSLRFPRLVEWGRIDKRPEEVTGLEEIRKML